MVHPDTIIYHQRPGPDGEYRLLIEVRAGLRHRYLIVPEKDEDCFKLFSCAILMPKLFNFKCDLIHPADRRAADRLFNPKVRSSTAVVVNIIDKACPSFDADRYY
jgi:hypothetical protein